MRSPAGVRSGTRGKGTDELVNRKYCTVFDHLLYCCRIFYSRQRIAIDEQQVCICAWGYDSEWLLEKLTAETSCGQQRLIRSQPVLDHTSEAQVKAHCDKIDRRIGSRNHASAAAQRIFDLCDIALEL